VPAQLKGPVFGETVPPSTACLRAQAALNDPATPSDQASPQYQARGRHDEDEPDLGKGEYKLI
jgi:hypothetical protein